ncbi:STAS/SEC14 domain-containing protein [Limnofasciculus baicalensis]|uniref:STAS/SEC14 domain-containing protein n=1 Tax=Limnofasciculus baicalensis BBK-W-15 TaxID=2699891 RepID=A0AAE3GZ05_9CYAN|nr:STAS/SEC14 domain-containing protein [Limnofasciculus baicalensis]MCP2731197.1 STAS/SEC14 domain-containing protein [Limnofasciculus baicalensis BBK-W-15]
MLSIQVQAQVSSEQLLKAVENMPRGEFEEFIAHLLKLRAQRLATSVSKTESELLVKINQAITIALQNRFNELVTKRVALTLTQQEYTELLQLTDEIENIDAVRVGYLGELACLRHVSLTQLMADLGIKNPA